MNNRIIIYSCCLLLSIWSCKTSQSTQNTLSDTYAIFSEGGGFAGSYESWSLNENGQVFIYREELDSTVYYGDIDVRSAQQILHNLEQLKVQNVQVNKPANLYRKIQYFTKGEEVTWLFNPMEPGDKRLEITQRNFKALLGQIKIDK